MLFRHIRLWIAGVLLLALWGLSRVRETEPQSWVRPIGTRPGPVRILRFHANVGLLTRGQKALLCYGVENARKVRISPALSDVYPSLKHCLEIVPDHTTHYVLLAEGYDGRVTTRSFTLPVQAAPVSPQIPRYAEAHFGPRRSSANPGRFLAGPPGPVL
jgi:hypothetical protein